MGIRAGKVFSSNSPGGGGGSGEGGTQNEGCLEGASSGGRGEGWGVALLGGSRAMPGCACGDSKHGRVCNGLFVTQGLRA